MFACLRNKAAFLRAVIKLDQALRACSSIRFRRPQRVHCCKPEIKRIGELDAPDSFALETGCSGRILLVFRFSDELKGRIEFGRPGVLDRLFRDLTADHRGAQVWIPFDR